MTLEEIKEEAEKTWNFNRSHNVSTSQPKAIMTVSEAKKLFDKLLTYMEESKKVNK